MEAMINNLIKATGWSILHSLWQGAIIYVILFIVLMAWPKMNAKLKHNLAFGSLFLIFASFCFTFFSIFELPTTTSSIKNIAFNETAYQNLTQLSKSLNFKTEAYFPLVVTTYLIGIIFQLIILLSSYIKLKKLKQVNTLSVPAEWSSIFELTLTQLKINKTVKFFLSSKVNVPLVIGFFKPVVLFPVALATQLDLKQVEAILIHELSHIRRNDYLINLVKTCIETLLFFNPFVWLTTKFIHIEREHACDDLVVNFTGTPLTYAHALLKLELLKDKQTPSLSLAATGKNQHLYQRIKRITDMKTNYMNAKQQFLILTLTIATVASLAWINPTKKPSEKAKKPISLTLIKTSPEETKDLKNHLIVKADTDTTKKKKQFKMVFKSNDGKEVTYTSIDDMPDSLKKKIAAIEKKFNSPEWKDKMAKIEFDSKEMEKKFNSPEWKDKMAKVQQNAEVLAKKFQSQEWKDQMAKVQEESLTIAKKFQSKEWQDRMAKIEFNAKEMEKKFNSPEWKDKMAKIEFNSKELEKKFNSPEWKSKMADIQKNAEEMNKKFNSKEWKDKMEEMKKLQDSPEYKELRKKYEKDLEELKKAKGIKTDKAFLLFDSNLDVQKAFLPLTAKLATVTNLKLNTPDVILENPSLKLEKLNSLKLDATAPLKLELQKAFELKLKEN
ncbi:M56 family metallopeptidase [Pedobacter boryungensis]|uniref:M48 family metalloprotease n=1 Tax=Pedobacter boryungensis TaxID=869962 RepID=A0ABX2DEG1_9SPHI|nr:M56 family metallopeptidase [Pedobacter boryungensis]NQX32474.1 M48 family metalloprotease [Pedobacter boryungensis]